MCLCVCVSVCVCVCLRVNCTLKVERIFKVVFQSVEEQISGAEQESRAPTMLVVQMSRNEPHDTDKTTQTLSPVFEPTVMS